MKDEISRLRHSKDENDRKRAILLLEKFLSENPNDAEAWYDKAGCHDFIGEETAAEPCYRKCYDLGWKQLPPAEQKSLFVGFGSTLRNNFKFDESIAVLEEGFKNFPESPVLLVFLAFSLYSKNMHQRAVEVMLAAAPLIAKHGLDGYERAVQWYADHLQTHPEARK